MSKIQQLSEQVAKLKECCCKASSFKTITYEEALILIEDSKVKPGTLYRITGVHKNKAEIMIPVLYDDGTNSGTTIYVWGITTTEFSTEGWGEFWNPKYDQNNYGTLDIQVGQQLEITDGGTGFTSTNNVEANSDSGGGMTVDFIAVAGVITSITINTLGTGYAQGDLLILVPVSGDPAFFTLNALPYLYNIWDGNNPSIVAPNTVPGRKSFWGGYVWENTTGLYGSAISSTELDTTDWTKVPYNTTDYDFVIDYMEYDWEHDWISRRRSTEHVIDITFTYDYWNSAENTNGVTIHGIAAAQWGNHYSILGYGTDLIVANNAYIENVNFKGQTMLGVMANHYSVKIGEYFGINTSFRTITLNDKSSQINNIYDLASSQTNVTLEGQSTQNGIQLIESYQEDLKLSGGSQQNNVFSLTSSHQSKVTLLSGSIQNGTYTAGSYEYGNTYRNQAGSILTLSGSIVSYCEIDNCTILQTLTHVTKSNLIYKNGLVTSVTDTSSDERYSYYGNTHNEFNFKVTFTGAANAGAVGAIKIPIMPLSEAGMYIEEVIISSSTLTAGPGSYITLGILTDDVDSGLDSISGLVTTLSNATLKYESLPFTRSAVANRYLVMDVGANAITAGSVVLYVKTRRRTFS